MVRKKSEFLEPIPGKTYEVGDVVTVLDKCLPGTCPEDYRFGFYEYMLKYFGSKKWIISEKVQSISARKYKVLDDGYVYCLKGGANTIVFHQECLKNHMSIMIRKKIEFLMKPVPGKTYEVGDMVTILWNYVPGTRWFNYELGLSYSMLNYFGGKSFKILEKTRHSDKPILGYENCPYNTIPDDGYSYRLEDIKTHIFSIGMFKESYKYDKKKVFRNSITANPGEDLQGW